MSRARSGWKCPSCGVLNRPKRHDCVQCGTQAPPPEKSGGGPLPEEGATGRRSVALLAVAGLALAATAAALYLPRRSQPVPTADAATVVPNALAPTVSISIETSFTKGRRLFLTGQAAEALELLAQAVEEEPGSADAHSYYAQALWATGDRTRALAEFNAAVEAAPGRTRLRLDEARALAAADRRDDAARAYDQVIARDPSSVEALHERGKLHLQAGAAREAVDLMRRALEVDRARATLHIDFAHALEEAREFEAARTVYQGLVTAAPGDAVLRSRLAEVTFQRGLREEAIAIVEERIAVEPANPLLHRTLGSLLERTGKKAEAAAQYLEYAKLAPNAADSKDLAERARKLEPKKS